MNGALPPQTAVTFHREKPLVAFAWAPLVMTTRTLHLKVKPESYPWLEQAAQEVNQVWNFCNATSYRAQRPFAGPGKWLSAFDLNNLLAGCGEVFGHIGIDVAQCVSAEFVARRRQFKKAKLSWRKASGSKRSLGWVPFKTNTLRCTLKPTQHCAGRAKGKASKRSAMQFMQGEGAVDFGKSSLSFMGKTIRIFEMERYLGFRAGGKLRQGNFAQNSLGEWFLNQVVDYPQAQLVPLVKGAPGLVSKVAGDPGSKATLTLSTGEVFHYGFYRNLEQKLSQAQKRAHPKQAKRISQKVKNQRDYHQHCDSKRLVEMYGEIHLGDGVRKAMHSNKKAKPAKSTAHPEASSQGKSLGKTQAQGNSQPMGRLRGPRLGKSLSDGAYGLLKHKLQYKSHWAGRMCRLVNERFTTQDCSNCGQRTGPKGLRHLAVRTWVCSVCKAEHDRDHNSAANMFAAPDSKNNPAFQPKQRLPLAGTR